MYYYIPGVTKNNMDNEHESNNNHESSTVNTDSSEKINQFFDQDGIILKDLEPTKPDQPESSSQLVLSDSIISDIFGLKSNLDVNNKLELSKILTAENNFVVGSNQASNNILSLDSSKNHRLSNSKTYGFGSQVEGLDSTFAMISFIIMLLLLI